MSVKISVIIPVYNAEKYLAETLDSVLNQTFADFEVIAVNDGSKDNSLAILKEYEKKDKRIKVIDKKNTGVSDTRNIGIKNAVGEYVCFVDSDDLLSVSYLQDLYIAARDTEADIVMCNYITFYDDKALNQYQNKEYDILVLENSNKDTAFMKSMNKGIGSSSCNRIIKLSILRNYCIYYDTEMTFGEDMFFNWKAVSVAEKVVYIDKILYFYRQIGDSSIIRFHADLFKKYKTACLGILNFFNKNGISDVTFINEVYICFTKRLASFLRMIIRDKCSYDEKRRQINDILNDKMFMKALYDYREDVYQNEANHAVKMYKAAEKRRINTLIWCGIKYECRLQWGRKIKGYLRKIKK
ncbi:MAG: glycosyltransferase family 2 protein [bacterium]|nr:glycosyltransferase family 2 protein [bacterium]